MSFAVLNTDVVFQINNKILFKERFGDSLSWFDFYIFMIENFIIFLLILLKLLLKFIFTR